VGKRGRPPGPTRERCVALSDAGRAGRRHVIESILRPSATIAPHYQVWRIETADGKAYTGMLLRTYLDEYTYLDANGDTFKLNTRAIVGSQAVPASIMPDGLADLLTDQELHDLVANICERR
jgi:putative heme-binding domain-containing protein